MNPAFTATLQQFGALSGGSHVYRFENRCRRKNGSYCTLSWTAVPDAGHVHAIGRDITADLQHAEDIAGVGTLPKPYTLEMSRRVLAAGG